MLTENQKYVRCIAQELDAYAEGRMYLDEDGEAFAAGPSAYPQDCTPLSLYDYLDDALDVTYLVQSDRKTLDGVKVYITLGGPSIWIDTSSNTVELRWGGESASWGISWETAEAITEIYQAIWDMG